MEMIICPQCGSDCIDVIVSDDAAGETLLCTQCGRERTLEFFYAADPA